ncbi:hypothetical protein ABI125_09620 [Tamlana crocina]
MKKLHLTFIAFLMLISVHAQYGITKKRKPEAEIIKTLPLLVVLHDYDDPLYQRMRVDLKEAMQKYWYYSEDITFVSKDELREYEKDKLKRDNYAYLMFSEKLYRANVPAGCFCIGLLNKKTFTHFKKFGNYDEKLTMADYKQGLYWLQKDLETVFDAKTWKENNQNTIKAFRENVETSTLLVDESLVTDDLKDQMESVYSYNYKIVTKEEIDRAIMSSSPNILYTKPYNYLSRPLVKSNDEGHSLASMRDNVNVVVLNYVYSAENNQPLAAFKTKANKKTTLKHFKKGLKVLK